MHDTPSDTGQRLGSLCTGYGGLDLAVSAVLDVKHVWLAEFDQHAAKVCETRFPAVPNLHDITALDWQQVPPVDVLTAGYPCQPFSHAGRRQGVNDARHLWPFIAECLRVLRPRLAIFENVAGHLDLGFDAVLGDLAEIGFDAEWLVLRAQHVGACHQRARLFVAATNTEVERRGPWRRRGTVEGLEVTGRSPVEPGGRGDALLADPGGDGLGRSSQLDGPPAGGLDRASGRHADGCGVEDARRAGVGEDEPAPDANGEGPEGSGHAEPGWWAVAGASGSWGIYADAIDRHARVLGRPAPAAVDEKGRLSPLFVEWMMMLPAGWVTDVGLSRAQELKILGNGVVPLQAEVAVRHLLDRVGQEVAA